MTGAPEQIRCTPDSTVYTMSVPSGRGFYKAYWRSSKEAERSELIASLFPEHMDTVLSVDKELEALITTDHGRALSELGIVCNSRGGSPAYEDGAAIGEAALEQ